MGHPPLWERVSGPLGPYAQGFGTELARLGYTPLSAHWQWYLVRDLSIWLDGEVLGAADLTDGVVDRFFVVRRESGLRHHRSVKAAMPLLGYLRGLGVAPPESVVTERGPVEALLERYRGWLTGERGLTAGTARNYVDLVGPFVAGLKSAAGLDLEQLTPGQVTAFLLAASRSCAPKRVQHLTSALRSLLGFLRVSGLIEGSLVGSVPSAAAWRLVGLPRFLEAEQVQALLSSCDRDTANGRRDFAILTVLARLGLRAGEAAGLRLDDLDWRSGEISIRGKGSRVERLPLPADVGEAVAAYLRDGRPSTALDRSVFIRVKAPHWGLTGGITQAVAAAGVRAGLGVVHAHRLRHTAATGMLRAGATLPEVGQVLRHRRLLTTAIYAKVDTEALRTLARPWPITGPGGAR